MGLDWFSSVCGANQLQPTCLTLGGIIIAAACLLACPVAIACTAIFRRKIPLTLKVSGLSLALAFLICDVPVSVAAFIWGQEGKPGIAALLLLCGLLAFPFLLLKVLYFLAWVCQATYSLIKSHRRYELKLFTAERPDID